MSRLTDDDVLMAVAQLGDEAYGVPIYEALEKSKGCISITAMYRTLDRLESAWLLTSRKVEGGKERSGLPKRYFTLTEMGKGRLEEAKK